MCKFILRFLNISLLSVIIFNIESYPGTLATRTACNVPKIVSYNPVAIPAPIIEAEQFFSAKACKFENTINKNVLGCLKYNKLYFPFNNSPKINSLDLRHIALGSVIQTKKNKIKLSGLHLPAYCTGLIKEIMAPENKQGVNLVKINYENLTKTSSLFPVNWDEQMVSDKIIESLTAVQQAKINSDILYVLGKTPEGILIESRINSDGKIITSFPKY